MMILRMKSAGLKLILVGFWSVLFVTACSSTSKPTAPAKAITIAERALGELDKATARGETDSSLVGQLNLLGDGWVLVDTTALFPKTTAPAVARLALLNGARQAAIEKVLPLRANVAGLNAVLRGDSLQDQALFSSFIITTQLGNVVEEVILKDEIIPLHGGDFRYHLQGKFKVETVIGEPDPSFVVRAWVDDNLLHAGDEVILKVRCSRPGYLYVFDFMADGQVLLVYPHPDLAQVSLAADQTVEIPTPAQRRRGFHLRVQPLARRRVTHESLYVLVTRKPLAAIESFPRIARGQVPLVAGNDPYFLRLQKILSRIPLDQRTEAQVPLIITSASSGP